MSIPGTPLTSLHTLLNRISPLSDDAWSAAEPIFQYRTFEAGKHLIRHGDDINELYFLTIGLVRFYYLDTQGREFNKSFSTPGQVLSSLSSLVEGSPSPFSIQALASSECLILSYSQFLKLSNRFPEWRSLQIRLLEQLIIRKERREADFLLLSATERYHKFLHEYAHIAAQIPNYHIAAYLGITEVALSRIRSRLRLT